MSIKKSPEAVKAINDELKAEIRAVYDAYIELGKTAILAPPAHGRPSSSGVLDCHVAIARRVRKYQTAYFKIQKREHEHGYEYGALACLSTGLMGLGLDRRKSDLSAHARLGEVITLKKQVLKGYKESSASWRKIATTICVKPHRTKAKKKVAKKSARTRRGK